MNDRELLELAAKAAGYEYRPTNGCIVMDGIPGNWNPLTDDGDALRLAVELKIDVSFFEKSVEADHLSFVLARSEIIDDDKFKSVRRAIVRAAAEIGRNMP